MMLVPITLAVVFVVPAAQEVTLTPYQKQFLVAFQKAGFKEGEARVVQGIGKRTEIPLSKNGEQFVLTFGSAYTMIEQKVPLTNSSTVQVLFGSQVKEKFPSVRAEFDAQGVTLSRTSSPVDLTPGDMMDDMLADVQGAAKLFAATAPTPPTPAPTPSDSLGASLKDAGLAFKDIGGYYSLKFDFSNAKRSQTAYVRQDIYTSSAIKTRKIVSFCYDDKNAPSAETLRTVFQKRLGIGGLGLEAPDGTQKNWRIFFRIDAPVEISPDLLKQYLVMVAATADDLEKELKKEDKL